MGLCFSLIGKIVEWSLKHVTRLNLTLVGPTVWDSNVGVSFNILSTLSMMPDHIWGIHWLFILFSFMHISYSSHIWTYHCEDTNFSTIWDQNILLLQYILNTKESINKPADEIRPVRASLPYQLAPDNRQLPQITGTLVQNVIGYTTNKILLHFTGVCW